MARLSFKKANARRGELIDKKYCGAGLSPEEVTELERLQKFCGDWIDQRYPLNFLKLDELEARLGLINE